MHFAPQNHTFRARNAHLSAGRAMLFLQERPRNGRTADGTDAGLDAGIALLHFAAVAAQLLGKGRWELDPEGVEGIPESGRALARYWM